jgi:hypothetical protein
MNEKSENISQDFIVKKQNISVHAITNFADCLVAGTIGIASAVTNDHPLINSKIPGRIFDRPACADPTPGQEKLLSTSCRKHSFPGVESQSCPCHNNLSKNKNCHGSYV